MNLLLATSLDPGEGLAQLAEWLRVPVFVLALLALIVTAIELGRFTAEWWRRRKQTPDALRALIVHARARPETAADLALKAPSEIAAVAIRDVGAAVTAGVPDPAEHALADYELAAQRRLDRTRLLVRAGPALGLMGTLIPLAPGLARLGEGDLAGLADDLQTAFGATVIGLLVGTVAYALTLARTRTFTEDLAALERGVADPLPTATVQA